MNVCFYAIRKKDNSEDVRGLWFQFLWSGSCIDSKPFTPEHQYAYSPYFSKENLFSNQEKL